MNCYIKTCAYKLLLCCTLWQCLSALPYRGNYGPSYSDPKCTDEQTGRELFIGDSFTRPGQCIRVQCLGSLSIWEDSCQHPRLQGNCRQLPVANEYLDYPKCCPMYECKTYETNENGGTEEETRTYDHYGTMTKTLIVTHLVRTDFQNRKSTDNDVDVRFNL